MKIATHLDRPSLDYWHAFDYCAAKAWQAHQPITLLSSSHFYYRHLADRLDDRNIIHVDTTAWSRHHETQGNSIDLAKWTPQQGAWIWAEPAKGTLKTILQQYIQTKQAESRLIIISSGWLAKRLPEWQTLPTPVIGPAGGISIQQALNDAKLVAEDIIGFHGPLSIALGFMGTGLAKAKQPAFADRAFYSMRKHYTVGRWQASVCPVQARVIGGS